jgi:DNA-directed RNA polymerase subunit beta'
LLGLKENVIVGHLIPAGTGMRRWHDMVVGSQDEYDRLLDLKESGEDTKKATVAVEAPAAPEAPVAEAEAPAE